MNQPQSGSARPGRPENEARPSVRRDDRERQSTESAGYGTGSELDPNHPAWRSRSLMAETARAGLGDRAPAPGPGVSPELGPPGSGFPDGAPGEPRVMSPVSGRWYREPLAVADLMTKEVKTVSPDTRLAEVAALMRDEDVGVVPVVDSAGRLNGIVTDRDLVVRALAGGEAEFPGQRPDELNAAQVSTKDVEAVSPHDSITDVLNLMGRKQIRRAPVVDNQGRLVGMISLGDIAKHADNDHELQETLQRISARRSFWTRIWR